MAGFEIGTTIYYELEAVATVSGGMGRVSAKLVVFTEGDNEVPRPTEDEVAQGLREWLTTEYPGFQNVSLDRIEPAHIPL
jgi:hypothetical protein